jgi:hypothetical protein
VKRKLFNAMAVLSAVLCVATVVLWAYASCRNISFFTGESPSRIFWVATSSEILVIGINPMRKIAYIGYWQLVVPAAALAAAAIFLRGRNRRRSNGTCRKCGYDLRATPERCPECGTVPTRAAA